MILYRAHCDVAAGATAAKHIPAVQGHMTQAEVEVAATQADVQAVDGTSQQHVLALRSALSTLQQVLARIQEKKEQAQEEAQAAALHARPSACCHGHWAKPLQSR
jgi:ribosome-associated translation inhibitor RaiA